MLATADKKESFKEIQSYR